MTRVSINEGTDFLCSFMAADRQILYWLHYIQTVPHSPKHCKSALFLENWLLQSPCSSSYVCISTQLMLLDPLGSPTGGGKSPTQQISAFCPVNGMPYTQSVTWDSRGQYWPKWSCLQTALLTLCFLGFHEVTMPLVYTLHYKCIKGEQQSVSLMLNTFYRL